jgi:precorrin-2 dehydrogenase / sirohydrochlorin ferrochelatase
MALFPVYLKLDGKIVLVVGGGEIAEGKVEALLTTHASVRLVSPELTERLFELAQQGKVMWRKRQFEPHDLEDAVLSIAATDKVSVNHLVYRESQRLGIWCNVVDDPPYCDFYFPAVVRRGDLQIAISTNGQSPSFAQLLRKQLEKQFTQDYAQTLAKIGEQRRLIMQNLGPGEERRSLLLHLAKKALAAHEMKTNEAQSA